MDAEAIAERIYTFPERTDVGQVEGGADDIRAALAGHFADALVMTQPQRDKFIRAATTGKD